MINSPLDKLIEIIIRTKIKFRPFIQIGVVFQTIF